MTFSGPNLWAISHLELVNRAAGVPHRDVSMKGKPGTVTPGGAQPVSISWTFVRNSSGKNKIKRDNLDLAGPEPGLNFGGGSLQCVNTAPSGIEIRTIGVWFLRGDTTASIEVCMPVTVGQVVHPSSIYISDQVSARRGD